MVSPPASLAAVVQLCQQIQGPQAPHAVSVLKLLNQIIIYSLWHERNARIFQGLSSTQEAFFRVVDRAMRDKLLSLSRTTWSPAETNVFASCSVDGTVALSFKANVNRFSSMKAG
ncbi:hypothetical protein YC2023_081419 [Brassica napus]